ncbi:MAG: SDR family NAD(P)-dependent oxidoreductase [Actinomycetota bacterium]|jgi:NAD(P)-dependent dehydrogenase (short-subunit alcohol dehydrogenase family)
MSERFENGFAGRVAVVTGAGTGMGRELVRQLTADGCDVAVCDVIGENLRQTAAMCAEDGNTGQVLEVIADVSSEEQILAFRDAVAEWRPHVNLLFNNAGIAGGGSIVNGDRAQWDKTFAVCWNGVYLNTRAFMPLLMQAPVGHVINTSSVNGFWASVGPDTAHSAYCSAKFAVKGFTEALITDFAINAPHLRASVVMPGHIGTSIVINSLKLNSSTADSGLIDVEGMGELFRDNAPMTAAEAATIMLNAVKNEQWRVLVGADAELLDAAVRARPNEAYQPNFFQLFEPQD